MFCSICLHPSIFKKNNLDEFRHLFDDIEQNGFLIMDDDEFLFDEYYKNLQNLDQDTRKDFSIFLDYLKEKSNQIIYIGRIDSKKLYSSFSSKIKNLKIVKNQLNPKYKNLKKIDSFFVITSEKEETEDNLKKQSFNHFIENYFKSPAHQYFKSLSKGIVIQNKNVDEIIYNYLIPILWHANEISFFSKEITTKDKEYKEANFYKFEKLVNEILNYLEDFYLDKEELVVQFIYGSADINILKDVYDRYQKKFNKRFPKIKFKHKGTNDTDKIKNIHSRSILSDKVCVSFEKTPEFKDSTFKDYYNKISIDDTYKATAKNLSK